MKIRHIIVAATTAFLLTSGNAWAGNNQAIKADIKQIKAEAKAEIKQIKQEAKHQIKLIKLGNKGGHHKAPEINAASGTSAIALLTGVLLLAGEKVRSRRT
jgi:hypothetical protein